MAIRNYRRGTLEVALATAILAGCSVGVGTTPQTSGLSPAASSRRESVLHAFGQYQDNAGGTVPVSPVVFGKDGAIYGTTWLGGTCSYEQNNCGTVFKLTRSPSQGGHWNETVLYAFCPGDPCVDGANPEAGLIFDSQGSLYGTTNSGGRANKGTVFKLTPSGSGYSESVLYSFCQVSNCADGAYPVAGLVFDKHGALYGTTEEGGRAGCSILYQSCGTVFKLTPSGSVYRESVLYSFCKKPNCSDGANPAAGLVMDAKGGLYGTTQWGGNPYGGGSGCGLSSNPGCGAVFKLTKSRSHYVESILYRFCDASLKCPDGARPVAGLIFDKQGALYGTTRTGGNKGGGIAFSLTPSGSGYTYRVLYSFCAKRMCRDGSNPFGGVVLQNHALYGTTKYGGIGGTHEAGTLFSLTPSASGYRERVLHRFVPVSDESNPIAAPVFGPDGALYGTSEGDTIEYGGAVWKVRPSSNL